MFVLYNGIYYPYDIQKQLVDLIHDVKTMIKIN